MVDITLKPWFDKDVLEDLTPHYIITSYTTQATITLPEDWSSYEYFEFAHAESGTPTRQRQGTQVFYPANTPVGGDFLLSSSSAITAIQILVTVTDERTLTGGYTNGGLIRVTGYKRRLRTENLSAIISVNNGANVGANQRYELDVATVLGADYVGRNLIVRGEIYNDGGVSGDVGWGDAGYQGSGSAAKFARASTRGDVINFRTGLVGLTDVSNLSGNPFENTSAISLAPCRIKVWKIDQYVTNNTQDSIDSLDQRVTDLENA